MGKWRVIRHRNVRRASNLDEVIEKARDVEDTLDQKAQERRIGKLSQSRVIRLVESQIRTIVRNIERSALIAGRFIKGNAPTRILIVGTMENGVIKLLSAGKGAKGTLSVIRVMKKGTLALYD
ncbi:hypothetical protein L2E82_47251 [Cichorium intybus]|uniref:Uncharacterized protein n=1 Tax=Cichorium intybus TaxID=13427 RepID=A0ACB8YUT9_CICIN|nr:hypothetical protein L2E82_47251 [Cichorium intybus]